MISEKNIKVMEENIQMLEAEMDYHLASLHLEIQQNDVEGINKTKCRLKEIAEEINKLKEMRDVYV